MRQKGILHRQKEKSMRVMQVDVMCDVVAREKCICSCGIVREVMRK